MSSFSYDSDEFDVTMDRIDDTGGRPPSRDREENDQVEDNEEDDQVEIVDSDADGEDVDEMDTQSNNNLDDYELDMPQRKLKEPAAVWKVADRVMGGAKCKLCHKLYKCLQGNTSNIIRHLVTKHKNKEEVKLLIREQTKKKEKLKLKRLQTEKRKSENSQPLITSFSKRRGILDPLKKKRLDAALVKMTVCMNRPFEDVENHHLRNLLYIAEPDYIVPSRRRHTLNFDSEAALVEELLKKEVVKDVTEAGHKTITITSDHGTSKDQFRTKKNALTVARCDKDFVIKKDIVKMIKCEGSQTGRKIREDVKIGLQERAGWQPDWTVNWVTDNEVDRYFMLIFYVLSLSSQY